MDYSIDSMIIIITAYMLGMAVTSLMNKRKDKELYSILDAYESIIADITSRIDVIDLRLSHITNNKSIISQLSHGSVKDNIISSMEGNSNSNNNSNGDSMPTSTHNLSLPILNVKHIQHMNKVRSVKTSTNDLIKEILDLLADGPKTSREIEKAIGKSREHTARLMKRLYDMGYIKRDESMRPYKYTLA
jgi:DNA-binding transcriptional ArsR family regulator